MGGSPMPRVLCGGTGDSPVRGSSTPQAAVFTIFQRDSMPITSLVLLLFNTLNLAKRG